MTSSRMLCGEASASGTFGGLTLLSYACASTREISRVRVRHTEWAGRTRLDSLRARAHRPRALACATSACSACASVAPGPVVPPSDSPRYCDQPGHRSCLDFVRAGRFWQTQAVKSSATVKQV
eukprot:7389291-Prymnesium_polylepis.1